MTAFSSSIRLQGLINALSAKTGDNVTEAFETLGNETFKNQVAETVPDYTFTLPPDRWSNPTPCCT